MLRRNDSNWRISVRIVMVSAIGVMRVSGTRFLCRGDCASRTFRTLEINFLLGCKHLSRVMDYNFSLLMYRCSGLSEKNLSKEQCE